MRFPTRIIPTDFTDEELDYMYEDDTVDIKNFGRMPKGKRKRKFKRMLIERMNWYLKRGLVDWAEQIEVAIDIDNGVYNG